MELPRPRPSHHRYRGRGRAAAGGRGAPQVLASRAPRRPPRRVRESSTSIGPASFAFDYEVTRDGLLLVSGWTRLAVCERDFGRALPTPAWLRDLCERIPSGAVGGSWAASCRPSRRTRPRRPSRRSPAVFRPFREYAPARRPRGPALSPAPEARDGGVCSNCGRPICHECMIDAPVRLPLPRVRQGTGWAPARRAKVVTRGEIRSRWGAAGGVMSGGAPVTRSSSASTWRCSWPHSLFGAVGIDGGGSTSILVKMGALVPAYVAVKHRLLRACSPPCGWTAACFTSPSTCTCSTSAARYLQMIAGKGNHLAIYLVAGVAGNVAVYLLAAPRSAVTIGASTAIFGIFGALFTYSLHNRGSAVGRALQSMGTVHPHQPRHHLRRAGDLVAGPHRRPHRRRARRRALTCSGSAATLRTPFGARDSALWHAGHRRHGRSRHLADRQLPAWLSRDFGDPCTVTAHSA